MFAAGLTNPNDPHEWLRRARSSAQLARCSAPGVDPADLCFQAQQAVEKAIKAVLVAHGIIAPRSHELRSLLRRVRAAGIDVPGPVRDAEALTVYAVDARYPGGRRIADGVYEATLPQMDAVLTWATHRVERPGEVREQSATGYHVGGRPDPVLLRGIVASTVRAVAPDRIILFGSAARNAMHKDSDIDLLVVKTGADDPHAAAAAIYRELDCDIPVDVVVVSPEALKHFGRIPGYVYHDALVEGRVIYEAAQAVNPAK
jgi:HEPN domain-containing protein/predicted nucleotidyltransferase